MKRKLLLLIFFVFVYVACWSQLSAGNQLIGPSLNISSYKTVNENSTVVTNSSNTQGFGLGLNWIKMKTATEGFGITIGYNYSIYKNYGITSNDYTRQKSNSAELDLFRRKYIPIHAKWSLFYDVGLSGAINKTKNVASGSLSGTYPYFELNGYSVKVFGYPGIAYFIKRNFLVDISLPNFLVANFWHQKYVYPPFNGVNQSSYSNSFNFNSTVTSGNFFNNMAINFRWILR
ncbi:MULTISPECIES: hypothetical protein [unclassified Hydrotalea]|uniref:hypothetical protein n=1 Tax=unclassified Hydrotalea TaxID=2643788 RepID=UPI0009442EF5|nr:MULTISPECIES: hypothetical protein [unclassified Hydrotalea]RWZ86652.1 MAG: hypothetical protein EO766_13795 [Hydrotalea sp. AMD]